MDPELVNRIYECSFVPELWPGVLDELGRIAETAGGTLFISKAEVRFWTASPENHYFVEKWANERWLWHGQLHARALAACHAGFLTELDLVHS